MKKALIILLIITAIFISVVAGVFIGRNSVDNHNYITEETPNIDIPTTAYTEPYGLLNINTVTLETLMDIPGIGKTIAQRILDYRDANGGYTSMDELLNVEGIGQTRLAQLKEYLSVGGEP